MDRIVISDSCMATDGLSDLRRDRTPDPSPQGSAPSHPISSLADKNGIGQPRGGTAVAAWWQGRISIATTGSPWPPEDDSPSRGATSPIGTHAAEAKLIPLLLYSLICHRPPSLRSGAHRLDR
jgi:hypothetical protein